LGATPSILLLFSSYALSLVPMGTVSGTIRSQQEYPLELLI
jgi:hypothetical protein